MKIRRLLFVVVILALAVSACVPQAPAEEAPMEEAPVEEAAPVEEEAAPAEEAPAEEEAAGPPAECEADEFGCAVIPAGDTIKVGMGAPLLGDYSMFGIDISQGVEVALVQDDGFEGWSYELVAEDTGGAPEAGAAVANKMVTDPTVVAIAGHIFSGSTAAAMPIYEKAGFPMMSPSATLPELTEKGSAVFNRLAFTDATQAKFAAQLLFESLGVTKLAVMHDGSSYGQGLAEGTKAFFEELGGEVVAVEAITPGEVDYIAPLSSIAAKGPEAIYYGGYAAEAIVMANQWQQAGLDGVTLFGCDGTYGVEFTDKAGPNAEGSIAVSLVPPDSAEKTAFDEAYRTTYGMEAGELSAFSWSSYDTGAVLVAAIEKVAIVGADGNLYVPRGALVEAVRTTDYTGLTGLVKCDEVGECNASGPTFYIVENGEWVPFVP
jgi:branched-chain amino acid transport system substrate-binding protein